MANMKNIFMVVPILSVDNEYQYSLSVRKAFKSLKNEPDFAGTIHEVAAQMGESPNTAKRNLRIAWPFEVIDQITMVVESLEFEGCTEVQFSDGLVYLVKMDIEAFTRKVTRYLDAVAEHFAMPAIQNNEPMEVEIITK